MAGTFQIHGRQHWTFQLVLLGARRKACTASPGWSPSKIPHDVAHALIEHPSCAL